MKETIEEVAEKWNEKQTTLEFGKPYNAPNRIKAFIEGVKWQQEQDKNKYSEEEVYNILEQAIKDNSSKQLHFFDGGYSNPIYTNLKKWFEQFKKK
jgi:hypothetical protein